MQEYARIEPDIDDVIVIKFDSVVISERDALIDTFGEFDGLDKLLDLKFENGNYIMSGESLYEAIYLLNEDWDSAIAYLNSGLQDTKDLIFSSSKFGDEKLRSEKEKYIYTMKPIAVSGIFKCKLCGSDKSKSSEIQTRSADEPMTVRVTCLGCQNTITING